LLARLKPYGFTLLEILVVLFIVSIMSAVVVLNVNAPSYANFIANARKIAATLSILSDEALYTNSVILCEVSSNGLQCRRYKNEQWTEINIAQLVSWTWPDGVTVENVYVNGVGLKDDRNIRFFASGDQQPISLQVTNGKYHTWIDGDISGVFQVNN